MDQLPNSLVLEILQKLPVKSIFKFKSVSKHWLSLISHPSFPRSYTNHQHHSPRWTLISGNRNGITLISPNLSLPFLLEQHHKNINIRQLTCSNGLLLYSVIDQTRQNVEYRVCNPLTKKLIYLPKPLSRPNLAREGFLVDPNSGHFLVVRAGEFKSKLKVFDFEVFASEFGEWVYVKLSCPRFISSFVMGRPSVCYRGVLHWLVDNYTIIAFDPKSGNNECCLIDLPRDRESRILGILGVSCECLYYLEMVESYGGSFQTESLGLWMLTVAGEWCLKYKTRVSEIWSSDAQLSGILSSGGGHCVRPLAFDPFDSDIVFLHSSFNGNYRLLLYNLSNRSLEVVNGEVQGYGLMVVCPFVFPVWPTPVPQPFWEANYL
ncbi:hypothetical protein LguiB_031595 [Lonicera macranthoides]